MLPEVYQKPDINAMIPEAISKAPRVSEIEAEIIAEQKAYSDCVWKRLGFRIDYSGVGVRDEAVIRYIKELIQGHERCVMMLEALKSSLDSIQEDVA